LSYRGTVLLPAETKHLTTAVLVAQMTIAISKLAGGCEIY
jgi:hypothetical protein